MTPASAITRISHHGIRRPLTALEEVVDPIELLVGIESIDVCADEDEDEDEDETVVVVVELGTDDTCIKSERQTPKSGTTFDDPTQFADTHDPARRT